MPALAGAALSCSLHDRRAQASSRGRCGGRKGGGRREVGARHLMIFSVRGITTYCMKSYLYLK